MCKIQHSGPQFSAWGSTETPLALDPESRNSAWSGGAAELCLQAVLRGEKPAVALENQDTERGSAVICYTY